MARLPSANGIFKGFFIPVLRDLQQSVIILEKQAYEKYNFIISLFHLC